MALQVSSTDNSSYWKYTGMKDWFHSYRVCTSISFVDWEGVPLINSKMLSQNEDKGTYMGII
jgi:hypothetical protein